MKLTKLTSEQKELLKANKQKFVKKFLNNEKINIPIAKELIQFVYSLIKRPMPTIYLASNPLKAQKMANQLKKTKNVAYNFGTYLGIYWASFYAWAETYVDLGIIKEDKFPKYFKLRKFIESNIYMSIEFEKAIIIVEKPMITLKNRNGLHNAFGKAIEWEDEYGQYYINGRNISRSNFLLAYENKLTIQMWLDEKNEDVKAAWFEILGSERVMDLLQAKEIDSEMRVHSNGEMDDLKLYKTSFILPEIGEPLAWIRFICPSTSTRYLISCNPKHDKVMDAVLDSCPFYGDEIKEKKDYSFSARG